MFSVAQKRVLEFLRFDSEARTASLSATLKGFPALEQAIHLVFGRTQEVSLSRAALSIVPTLGQPTDIERVTITGEAVALKALRTVDVDVFLSGGEIFGMTVAVPLPAEGWALAEGVTAVQAFGRVTDLRLRNALAIISVGLGEVPGGLIAGHSIRGQDLRDGVTFVGDAIVDGTGALRTSFMTEPLESGMPYDLLPNRDNKPNRVAIRVHPEGKWMDVELWWDEQRTPDGLAEGGTHASGLGLYYLPGNPAKRSIRWLWSVGTQSGPLVLEAIVLPKFPVRYNTRLGAPVPLGQSQAAISKLIGAQYASLLEDPPDNLSLISMVYEPGAFFSMTAAAGSRLAGSPHVLTVGPVELREVRYTIQGSIKRGSDRKVGRMIEARAAFFDVDFQVNYTPGEKIEGGLADPEGVRLGDLISKVMPAPLPFGLDSVKLRGAWLRRSLGEPGSTYIMLGLSGQVELLPHGAMTLEEVRVAANHIDMGATTGSLQATMKLGPVELTVQAARANTGWTFSGIGSVPDGVSLTHLIEHLVKTFDVAVPSELPDVKLGSVAIAFETSSRSLDIQATVTWTVDDEVPVLAGAHAALLGLSVAPDPVSGGRSFTLSVEWTFETEKKRRVEASVLLGRQSQTFTASLEAPGNPLRFSDLSDELGLTAYVPDLIEGALDEVFQVSTLSLNYTRPGNIFDLAWARPLEDGTLVAELRHDTLGNYVQVSWVATTETSTLGVRNLLGLTGHAEVLDGVEGTFSAVGLSGVVKDLEDLLTFTQVGFTFQTGSDGKQLVFMARSTSDFVDRSFLAVRSGENSGLVAGLSFREGKALSDIPFLPDAVSSFFKATEAVLRIEPTHVLVSTMASNTYTPPGFSSNALVPSYQQVGGLPASTPFGRSAMPLGKGLALGARIKLGDDPNNPLRQILDFDFLEAQVTIGALEVGLQAAIPGTLKLDAGGGTSLALTNAMIRVELNQVGPAFTVGGSLEMCLFSHMITVSGYLDLSMHGIEARLAMTGIELPPNPYLPGVHFRGTAERPFFLEVGLQFEPSGLMLGVDGPFYIRTAGRDYEGEVTFVLEIIDIVPQPLYGEFEIDALDIPMMLEAMTGAQWALELARKAAAVGEELPAEAGKVAGKVEGGIEVIQGAISHVNAILSSVSLDDARIRWCDSMVTLPDGSMAMPGVGFRGKVSLLGWDAFAALDFSTQGIPSLRGHFECEPITFGKVVRIWGAGQGVRKKPASLSDMKVVSQHDGAGKAKLVRAPGQASPDQGSWYLEPGGPVFHVSTQSSPFLYADLHARLFGFVSADIHAEVTDEGFSFDFEATVGPAHYNLQCHYWKPEEGEEGAFEASGDLNLHLEGTIGPIFPGIPATEIHLNTSLDASMEMRLDAAGFELKVRGDFVFQGAHLRMPELSIDVAFSSIEELAESIWEHIKAKAKDIFHDLLAPLVHAVEAAAQATAKVVMGAVKEAEKIVEDAVGTATQITHDAVEGMKHSLEVVETKAREVAMAAVNVVRQSTADAAAKVRPLHDQADRLRAQKGNVVQTALNHIAAFALDATAYVEQALLVISDLANKSIQFVKQRLDEARRWVEARLADAVKLVRQLEREAEHLVAEAERELRELVHELEKLGRALRDLANQIEHGLEHAGRAIAHAFGH